MSRKGWIIFFLSFLFALRAQDMHLSQIDASALYFNPASTGCFNGSFRALALHRQQWNGMGKGFITSYGSVEIPIVNNRDRINKGGVGGFFYTDQAGASRFKTNQASISASGIVMMGENHALAGGIQVSYIEKSFNMNNIHWVNQYDGFRYDPTINSQEIVMNPVTRFVDLGAGIRYQFDNVGKSFRIRPYQHFSINAAVFHPTEPFLGYLPLTQESLKMRWVGGMNLIQDFRGTFFGINMYGLYMKQGMFEQWMGGLLIRYRMKKYESQLTGLVNQNVISFGVVYRNTGFVIPNIRFHLSGVEIGLCYDAFISTMRTMPKGMNGFEIMLTYTKPRKALFKVRK